MLQPERIVMIFLKDNQSSLSPIHPVGQPDVAQMVLEVERMVVAELPTNTFIYL